ncbi:MAG: nucleotidyltransferase domain-containing protein [Methanobacterium sp.]
MKSEIDFKLRKEDKLLLYCARTNVEPEIEEKIVSIVRGEVDWDYLMKMGTRHRLRPLLYHNLNSICPEMVPESVLSELKDFFNANVRKNLMMTGELIKILELLKDEGIDAIPYKGPTLTILAYDDLKLREFNDLDIFIDKKDTRKIVNLMLSLDYQLDSYSHNMDMSLYFKTQSEHKFINHKKRIIVEIHNKFQGHFFYFPDNPDFLYKKENLKAIKINNYQINILSIENLILMLSIHCSRHNWSHLFWICDIIQIIQYYDINWQEMIKKAEILGAKRILLVTLYLASDLFDLKLPNKIIIYIENNNIILNICLILKIRLISSDYKPLNLFEKALFDLKKRESLKISIIDVFRSMFKPTYLDFKELQLSRPLYPLYYIIRPFLLLARYNNDSN